ncbi:MAG: cobalamin biosynthesis protein CobD [Rhodobacteraceae bacterium]|uniref:Cobalamin biosynthesis protein CobD n=1 Tax=Salipiger profundus TaxID=1229727 RepID=A0A1U7D3X1_9RHOB|nr:MULTISPECIES: adenosylcobinamide-phosphate synthase CbiB [Salipiger]APX22864.1 adenosylcobinamide-phosphate synthase [Salipiger profundus]MAB05734.1 cobalamin biosynthesis protein CobD [Paracoccaceae bacterium]GGA09107.1 cobalamin biosynthesis protein CobD [Salipiger profundus]SFC58134.1 adenosylcobinamide-phosphate synthase [Salipiger profundus]
MILVAFLIDSLFGWPRALFERISHPVVWIGALISGLEARLNDGDPQRRRSMGAVTVVLVLLASVVPAMILQNALPDGLAGALLGGLLAWPFLAVRSMRDHVADVARPLAEGDIGAARRAVAKIVGRDPVRLDRSGIARAALESLAENTSDGIVAPLFWGVIGGLPGLVAYKAINTMDSMIGHRNARYEDFGKAAARLDDLVNLVPARLTGLLFALASGRPRAALRVMRRDAAHHRSPNAGWPEAALAGALSVRLSGPRVYGDVVADEPWVNAAGEDAGPDALSRGLRLYRRTMVLCGVLLLVLL